LATKLFLLSIVFRVRTENNPPDTFCLLASVQQTNQHRGSTQLCCYL
jgi:hypothetical protein